MADKEGARKVSAAILVCSAPDVCKTPSGPSVVPVPYQITSLCSSASGEVTNVCMTGIPCLNLASILTTVIGDEAGVAGGVKSGVNKSTCEFISGSSTVNAGGKPVIRHTDPAKMNNGNTIGKVVYPLASASSTPEAQGAEKPSIDKDGKPAGDTEGSSAPETPAEKSWWDKTKAEIGAAIDSPWEGAKGAAKGAVNSVSDLSELAGKGLLYAEAGFSYGVAGAADMVGLDGVADAFTTSGDQWASWAATHDVPTFDMVNDAQQGGAKIFDAAGLATGVGGIVKSAPKILTKGKSLLKGAKSMLGLGDDVAKGADDLAKAGDEILENADELKKIETPDVPEGKGGGGGKDGVAITAPSKSVGHRRQHILNGHKSGANKPGKTEFPSEWSDDAIVQNVEGVANDPTAIAVSNKYGSSVTGVRDGVAIRVDFYPDTHPKYPGQISTAYPINVPKNQ